MQLRLATFNLESLGIWKNEDGPAARERLPRHIAALREVIRQLDADALAFQEVLDPDLLPQLLDGLDYPHTALGEPGSSPLRIGVCSRYPLGDAAPVAIRSQLSSTDSGTGLELSVRGAFSRPVLRVTWAVPAFKTTLFVVHNKSKIPSFTAARPNRDAGPWPTLGDVAEGRLITEVKRLAQAVELRKEIDVLLDADSQARVAVLGDFNDVLESEALRCLQGDAQAAESPHLGDRELYPCELELPPEERYSQIYRGQREMIDHILVSAHLRRQLRGVQVLNHGLRDTGLAPPGSEHHVGSDHAPLLAVFETG